MISFNWFCIFFASKIPFFGKSNRKWKKIRISFALFKFSESYSNPIRNPHFNLFTSECQMFDLCVRKLTSCYRPTVKCAPIHLYAVSTLRPSDKWLFCVAAVNKKTKWMLCRALVLIESLCEQVELTHQTRHTIQEKNHIYWHNKEILPIFFGF